MGTQTVQAEHVVIAGTGEWQSATCKPNKMDGRAQKLVDRWNSACTKLAELYDEVVAIHEAFNDMQDGEILGCRSFKMFCIRHLNRDASTVYRMLKKANLAAEPAPELEEALFDPAGYRIEEDDEEEEESESGGTAAITTKNKNRRPRLDMRAVKNAHYADRYLSMVALLTNAPKDASPQQIFETMQQEAVAAHQDLDADTARQIRLPQLVNVVARTWEDREIRRIAVKISNLIVEGQAALKKLAIEGSQIGRVIINNARTILEYDKRPSKGLDSQTTEPNATQD